MKMNVIRKLGVDVDAIWWDEEAKQS